LHTTDVESIISQGHGSHTGPLYPADGWGDIIPSFDYSGGTFPGVNWPAGEDILDAGCKVHFIPEPPDTTTTTTAAETTTTSSPTTATTTPEGTTTTSPESATTPPVETGTTAGGSETVPPTIPGETSVPGATTTTSPATSNTTTPPTTAPASQVPPGPTLTPGGELTTEVLALVITPGNRRVVLGRLNPEQRAVLREVLLRLLRRLAGTGSDNTGVVVLGFVAVFAGSALAIVATRRRSPLRGPPWGHPSDHA
jgi:hypothetical protein